jgi:hypothetical protein
MKKAHAGRRERPSCRIVQVGRLGRARFVDAPGLVAYLLGVLAAAIAAYFVPQMLVHPVVGFFYAGPISVDG